MDLHYKIIGSNEIREKLFNKLSKDENFILILNLDEILKDET